MTIALIGYGAMGKEIERIALDRGLTISHRLHRTSPIPTASDMKGVDVAIHFAGAESIPDSLRPWAAEGIPLVIGTTGWSDRLAQVSSLVGSSRIGLVHAANFSLGVNVFLQMVRHAAALMDRLPEYDASIHEIHHRRKADSPSGTALAMGRSVLAELSRKQTIQTGPPAGSLRPEQLQITSARTGTVVGTHTLTFDSAADSIELTHTAKNRSGFAHGALLAAEWVRGCTGIYTMQDVLEDLFRTAGGMPR